MALGVQTQMKAVAKKLDWNQLPDEVQPFVSRTQTFITPGAHYVVHGVSVYKRLPFFLVVDDTEAPVFLPSWIFSLTSTELPKDWICNVGLGDDVDVVLGPEFIARNIDAYVGMIDQETDLVDQFWNRCAADRLVDETECD